METENCLFIGGPLDGQWRTVRRDDNHFEAVEYEPPVAMRCFPGDEPTPYVFRPSVKVRYTRRPFFGIDRVFLLADLEPRQVVEMLLMGYRHPKGVKE